MIATMTNSITQTRDLASLLFLLMFIFSLLGMELFAGTIGSCRSPSGELLPHFGKGVFDTPQKSCVSSVYNGTWDPNPENFDRIATEYWLLNFLLLATGYWRLATGYWLLATGHWPLATGYWLLATCYMLHATCKLLLATYYLLLATCYLLPATCYLLPATCYLLLVTCY